MSWIRALAFGLVALLASCTTRAGTSIPPTASPVPRTPAPSSSAAAEPSVSPTDSPAAVSRPPGLSGRLLFSRFVESSHTFAGMFASDPDGTHEVEVPMPWTEGGGRWSTAGDLIAVPTQLDDGRVGTAILDANGAVVRVLKIATKGLNLPCTTWSPDDARLACEGWDDADPAARGLYTVRSSDGGDIQRITTNPAGTADEAGDWRADGRIVFKRYPGDEGPGPLSLVDAAGGQPTTLISDPQEDSGRFSPDGTLVATSSDGVIEVFDMTSARIATIERAGNYVFGPAWAPDGAWLVFSMTPADEYHADLYVAHPDGTQLYQATHTSDNEIRVDWGP